MKWLEEIRQQSYHKKIRLIWIIAGITLALLIVVWIVSLKFGKKTARDTTLFDTIGRGFQDAKDNIKDLPNFMENHPQ